MDWLNDALGPQAGVAILWTLGALFALGILLLIVRIIKSVSRNRYENDPDRRPRLAIMDAIAIDNNRRLVLVRRDDVEHLIMIGGANDLTVESGIGRRPVARQPQSAGPEQQRPTSPLVSSNAKEPTLPASARTQPLAGVEPRDRRVDQPEMRSDADSAIVHDRDVARPEPVRPAPAGQEAAKIDDEMDRLLGELSNHRS